MKFDDSVSEKEEVLPPPKKVIIVPEALEFKPKPKLI
jgi:hypothetical protein